MTSSGAPPCRHRFRIINKSGGIRPRFLTDSQLIASSMWKRTRFQPSNPPVSTTESRSRVHAPCRSDKIVFSYPLLSVGNVIFSFAFMKWQQCRLRPQVSCARIAIAFLGRRNVSCLQLVPSAFSAHQKMPLHDCSA